jgi:predicted nucleic acid-binding protein
MRVALDTNNFGFRPFGPVGTPGSDLSGLAGRVFYAPGCTLQLDELWATLHKPTIAARIKPYKAGRLVNELKDLAENVGSLPRVELSLDPTDDFLLALSEAGKADYLVTQATRAGCLRFAATKSRGSYPPAILPPCSDDSRGQGANYRLTTTGGVEKTTGSFWLVSMVGLRSSF